MYACIVYYMFLSSEENDSSDEWQPQYGSYNSQPTSISTDFRIWEPVGKKTENNGMLIIEISKHK